ncbi:MAG TPA: polysaccharide biosynthesis/export family protein [Candidatus Sumerlaeota bacterium]|nr:polysaccharide biosynthesis/export family protein [Candidatus Sumerlaeota bacterium]
MFLFLCFLGLWALSSCATVPSKLVEPPFEGREQGDVPADGLKVREAYRMREGDSLKVMVQGYEEFSGNLKVDMEGCVRLPYTFERLHLAESTLEEAETLIGNAFRPYIVGNPPVVLTLLKANSHFYYILGEVSKPGKYPIGDENVFVREAVVRAGWLKSSAGLTRAELVSSKPDRHEKRKIDLKKILRDGDLAENYLIEHGDILYVPPTRLRQFTSTLAYFLMPVGVLSAYFHGTQGIIDYTQDELPLEDVPDQFYSGRYGYYGSEGYQYSSGYGF